MTENYTLTAQTRYASQKQSARDTRAAGQVPAVVYGHGFDPTTISVDYSTLLRLYRKAGTSALIDLDIEGKKTKVLLHKLELHPVRQEIWHVDFYAVNLKEKTTVEIPLHYEGESLAVKNLGGIFMADHNSIALRCLPTEIPAEITVDISGLENIHDQITIADLGLDLEKFEVMGLELDTVLCSIMGHSTEEEEAPAAEGEEGEEAAEGEEGAAEEAAE